MPYIIQAEKTQFCIQIFVIPLESVLERLRAQYRIRLSSQLYLTVKYWRDSIFDTRDEKDVTWLDVSKEA